MKDDANNADPLATRAMPAAATSGQADQASEPHPSVASRSGSGRLDVRCPHCHQPTEVAVDTTLTDLTCSACGSHYSLVDQSKATRMAPSLSELGRFELVERIGVGGFGSVWKARDKELDRTVAIKIPRARGMSSEEQEQFFREARAAAQLHHPNIVSVHEVGRDGDSIYIVSDFVRGVTLGDWLTGQQLTSREAAELCAKIADALHHAHEQGVIHRDLKPANVMIDGDGQPHLMDFGLARREVGEVSVTMNGQILGTPAYMSPEQAQGEAHTADRRSDVYSLGVILFQLLTGELPFRGNARMLMHQVIHDEPPSPRILNSSVPRDLETITLKCLEKDAARRYQSASELARELRRFLAGEPILARPIGSAKRAWRWCRRNPMIASVSAVCIASIFAGFGVSTYFALLFRNQRDVAGRNLGMAEQAVEQYLSKVAEDERLKMTDFSFLRSNLLESAVSFYEQLSEQDSARSDFESNRGETFLKLAKIYGLVGRPTDAKLQYERAIQIFETLMSKSPKEPMNREKLAESNQGLARTLYDLGDNIGQAKRSNEARMLLSNLADDFPQLPKYAYLKACFLMELGALDEAQSIFEALVAGNPANSDYRLSLADVYSKKCYQAKNRRQLADARRFIDKAIALHEAILSELPSSVGSQFHLSVDYNLLGSVLRDQRDFQNAATQCKNSEQIALRLADQFPSVPSYSNFLASVQNNLGIIHENIDMRKAHEYFLKVLNVRQKIATTYPKTVDNLFALEMALSNVLNTATELGQEIDAVSYLESQINVLAQINEQFPNLSDRISYDVGTYTKSWSDPKLHLAQKLNELAWTLSTSNNSKIRDGSRALKYAQKACLLTEYKVPRFLDTLASAYAEAGDFDAAANWSEKSVQLLGANAESKVRDEFNDHLKAFKSRQPIRGKPPSN